MSDLESTVPQRGEITNQDFPASSDGLSDAEVKERVARGEVNAIRQVTSRRLVNIIFSNVFTRLNIILGALLIIILAVGSYRDALFGFALLGNILIGSVQEVRAKRTLDRLSVLTAPKAQVVRAGKRFEIPAGEVVLGDVLELAAGDQVIADGIALTSEGLEADESLLTGESAPVVKKPGDGMLSGSFIVAGSGRVRTTQVGKDAYAQKLSAEARRFKLANSELRKGISRIIRWVTWLMIPVGAILFLGQLEDNMPLPDTISGTVAGVVGMVPQGLAILAALAFAASAVLLARRNVLVQDLPAIEGLARVDTVCVDKTGTLTEGTVEFNRIEPIGPEGGFADVLGAFAAKSPASNSTLAALGKVFASPGNWPIEQFVPFSSARKWSAISFSNEGAWALGAPEILLAGTPVDSPLWARVESLAASGWRVLMLARVDGKLDQESLPGERGPAALILLEEKVRPDAAGTLRYFYDQGVTVKVISGDNPATAGAVARRAGVRDIGEPVDARQLPEDPMELAQIMEERTVFGRVVPEQKRRMVEALQSKGHVVAMTGDGVNDVLALKKADVAVAMGSGAAASKAVAQLILLDGRFATLPDVVAEGRRVVANIERVANLFLTKVAYVFFLALAISVVDWPFPFLPRHLTVIDSLTISTPAFFLSLAPNPGRYIPGFVGRVLRFTIPVGFIAGVSALVADVLAHRVEGTNINESRTMAAVVLIIIGLRVLTIVARPLTPWRVLLVLLMLGALVGALAIPFFSSFFALDFPISRVALETIGIAVAGVAAVEIVWRFGRSRGWYEQG
ncbi:MAG: HAD-IC family P-type ATPase [Chloroflexi bacterium]|nr:HAD-IC family P-type ATPase [Chloroflexota bacterium]